MGRKIDDAVIGKPRALDRGLAGIAAEMDVRCGCTQVFRHRVQLVRGIGKLRQGQCKLLAIDTHAAPEVGIGDIGQTARGCCCGALVGATFGRVEQGIAKAGHWLDRLIPLHKAAQGLQARNRRQHRHGMAPDEPGGIAIAHDCVGDGGCRLLHHKQMEWQCGERARRDHEQAALVLHDRFDRAEQRCIELVGKRKVEQAGFAGGIAGAADIEPLAQRGHLLRQRVRAERDLLPVEAIAGDCGDVALLLDQRKQHHRFIAGERAWMSFTLSGSGFDSAA
jgi:hypothetical protein